LARSRSPRSSSATVEAVLDQRRRQISELKVRVSSAEDRATSLRERFDAVDDQRRRLEQELTKLKDEREHLSVILICQ